VSKHPDGDKLVELLIEYGVGGQKAETSYSVVDLERFKQDSTNLS
jgi:restriction endonuclease Mrr